jgi:GTP-binding protein Era
MSGLWLTDHSGEVNCDLSAEDFPFKSGFIAIIGLPNVGKSTLLNRILDQKIAITSAKPQTTRNRILGIKNLARAQLIFIDTPGIHHTRVKFNLRLVKRALATLNEANAALWLVDATQRTSNEETIILDALRTLPAPTILGFNKIDVIRKEELLPLMERYRHLHPFAAIMPLSALTGEGVPELIDELLPLLPEGPQYFDPDMVTDLSERFLAAELVREKVMRYCRQELPYAVAVTVDSFEEKPEKSVVVIHAVIQVEKSSEKKIIVGKRGALIKRIGQQARKDIEILLGTRVFLDLFVRVTKNWRKDENLLRRLGY